MPGDGSFRCGRTREDVYRVREVAVLHATPTCAVLLLVACGYTSEPRTSTKPPAQETESDDLFDPFTAEFQWTAADGYTFSPVQVLGDLNDDGLSDARVRMCLQEVCENLIVHGPLRRAMTLPGDEVGTLPAGTGSAQAVGDATGDGIVDLRVVGGEDYLLLEGPLIGDMLGGTPSWGTFLDVNDDGILDLGTHGDPRTKTPAARLEIRYGPASKWDGEADIVLDPSCDADLTMSDWSFNPPFMDRPFTAELKPQLQFAAYSYADHCKGWWMTPPDPGTYDPETDLNAGSASNTFAVLPDQNGDLIAELAFPNAETTYDIVAGPVQVDDDKATGGEFIASTPVSIASMHPIPFDLNGDGIGEFLLMTPIADGTLPAGTTLVHGGADGLSAAGAEGTWAGLADQAFLEDGTVSIIIVEDVEGKKAAVVDLGVGVLVAE